MNSVGCLVKHGVRRSQHGITEQREIIAGADAQVANLAKASLQLADHLAVRHVNGNARECEIDSSREIVERAIDWIEAIGVGCISTEVLSDSVGQSGGQQRESGTAVKEDVHRSVGVNCRFPARRRDAHEVHGNPIARNPIWRLGRRHNGLRHQGTRELCRIKSAEDNHALLLVLAAKCKTESLGLRQTLRLQLVDKILVVCCHIDAVADPHDARKFILGIQGRTKLHALQLVAFVSKLDIIRDISNVRTTNAVFQSLGRPQLFG